MFLSGTSSENRSCPAKKGDDEKLKDKRSSDREDDEEKAKTGSKKQIARLEKLLEVQMQLNIYTIHLNDLGLMFA